MSLVLEKPQSLVKTVPEKLFFQVFLGFKKPDGYVSLFIESMPTGCGIYHKLAEIFKREPGEIYKCMSELAFGGKSEVFMQEYVSLAEASEATARGSLFANTSCCICFLKQEAFFQIKELKK